ncbi:citrate synthase [Evansella cellulosilytica]|uniref:Citrate synthase n=1 Tax=Evansella cellulosilytica (strain ATCC 21833 / DSM 2522 / FERM P-1141 / JCM 9156 / N-4) TaxID=649639 RepID=E6U0L7_EVAC2|nr:citrate synthase [Evansella cellulosilytica]ADU31462.1 2-methylcitrate synthase/citrate synthase II [Evansella cellulosilytica DSM 2522]
MSTTKGLEGVVATTSSVSSIIDGVLTYHGYNIDDLADHASFEEVVYLLWNHRLPNAAELKDFKEKLSEAATVPQEVLDQLKTIPVDSVHPMAVLRTAVSNLALFDDSADDMSEDANREKAIKLQAQLPTLVTAFSRIREGKEPVSPKSDLSFSANFLYMLTGKEPDEISEKAFNKALVLHADHELNASTFTARVCVATLSDMYSGITSAIGALKGPLHGGANERVMKMLSEIGDVSNAESYIKDALSRKVKIMGFGHRVYKNGDPRAKHLKEMSRQLTHITGETKWYEMSIKIDEIVSGEKGLLPNVDFYSASVYHSLGIEHDLFTPIFAVSRVSGWIAHILEQYDNNRLIRPRAEYTGPSVQKWLPVEER